jgi:hypothetical protein
VAAKDRIQRDRRADARDGGDDLGDRAQLHAGVPARADDEAVVLEHPVVERQGRDGDEGRDEEEACNARAPSRGDCRAVEHPSALSVPILTA